MQDIKREIEIMRNALSDMTRLYYNKRLSNEERTILKKRIEKTKRIINSLKNKIKEEEKWQKIEIW